MAKKSFNKVDKIDVENKELELSSLESGNKVPQAIDIEESILGAMMLNPDTVVELMVTLSEDKFYKPEHRRVFAAISALNKKNKPIDILTVAEELKFQGHLDEIGGPSFLANLTSKIGSAAHADYYAKILVDKYIQRQMIGISYDALKKSYDDSEPVDDLLQGVQQKLFDLAQDNMSNKELKISDIIQNKLKSLEELQSNPDASAGLRSGYEALDEVTYGWHPSDLVIIAGRPGMGKTSFVTTMARNMAVNFGTPVAFFSLEQSAVQLVERLLIAESGLDSDKIKGHNKQMTQRDWEQLDDKIADLTNCNIYIDETPALSISDFRAKARRLVSAGVKILVIDYLQLMTGSRDNKGNREQEVAEISRSLKAVAKELNVPIIALAQLSRQAADNQGGQKKPQLTHLRESGAIEQDADIVIFVHRPEYYYDAKGLGIDGQIRGLSEIIIAKHRNGETKDVYLKFNGSQMKFVDLDPEEKSRLYSKLYGNYNIENVYDSNLPNSFQSSPIESKINRGDYTFELEDDAQYNNPF